MRADRAVLLVGLVLVAAAVAGGSVSGGGVEIPVLDSLPRQVALGVLGVVAIGASVMLRFNPGGTDSDKDATQDARTPTVQPSNLLELIGPIERHQRVEVTITIGDADAGPPAPGGSPAVDADPLGASERSSRGRGDEDFYDRKRELEALRSAVFECSQGRASVVLVTGRGGNGKTALVNAYIRRFGAFFDAVVWMDRGVNLSELSQASTGTLIVLDAPSLHRSDLTRHIDACRATIILICRVVAIDPVNSKVVDVPEFTIDVAVQFLLETSGDGDEGAAREIASALFGSPLLLGLALRIVRTEGLTLSQYSQKYLGLGSPNEF